MPSLSIQLPDISRALVARICMSWHAQVWRPVYGMDPASRSVRRVNPYYYTNAC